ncbi:tetratricopeptide repeat protein [Erythrobacter mangrovi]|uniref:Tetratricopeptide repeat protein n=1 Tax=Erythrobacter mangrovi TaxID=2739433 RepID=A0A7D3XJ87_9SPHN|nr:tetratricopeptide repeat protein [Erythrobacter mangrovi]QKG72498.1 tetratricopeptide repeat protein [Erythrobacter mangrovi]
MALGITLALAFMAQAPVQEVAVVETTADVGLDELMAGRDRAALETIENCDELAAADPARLINRGIALARLGRYDEARADFEAAASARETVDLETAAGDWVDSRRLARRALAMLDKGEFARYYALSLR